MMKLFGGLLIIFTCTYMGININQKEKHQIKIIEALINDLTVLKINISNYSMPLPETFEKIQSRAEELQQMWHFCGIKIIEGKEPFNLIWNRAVHKVFHEDEIHEILQPLGNILGSSLSEDECSAIENVITRLNIIREHHEEEYLEKKKLSLRLGISFGILLFILLI